MLRRVENEWLGGSRIGGPAEADIEGHNALEIEEKRGEGRREGGRAGKEMRERWMRGGWRIGGGGKKWERNRYERRGGGGGRGGSERRGGEERGGRPEVRSREWKEGRVGWEGRSRVGYVRMEGVRDEERKGRVGGK